MEMYYCSCTPMEMYYCSCKRLRARLQEAIRLGVTNDEGREFVRFVPPPCSSRNQRDDMCR